MSTREKRLVVLLGLFAVLGLGIGLYTFVLSPWQESREEAAKLDKDLAEKTATLEDLEAKKRKLRALYAISLPGDPDIAQREYGALLNAILLNCKVPSGYTVTPKRAPDANRVPVTTGKTPAYTRTGYEIKLVKVDMPTLVRFLEAYYREPLLQQITHFKINRTAGGESEGGSRRKETRADLEVTIMTEGVIIDGAEKRETLLPVPPAFGALGGGLGLGLVQNSPQFARKIKPAMLTNVLSNRDFALLVAKDPFHGPLPPPPSKPSGGGKPPPVDTDTPPPEPPLEDISAFIRLTDITWSFPSGEVTAEIWDMANNFDYVVTRSSKFSLDGTTTTKISVKKFFHNTLGARKPLESFDEFLVIHEDDTATDRKFKVLDFTAEGLLLSERPIVVKTEDAPKAEKPKEDPKAGKSSFSKGGNAKGGAKTPAKKAEVVKGPQPLGAVLGALAFVEIKPAEKHYLWKIGSRLSQIEELPTPGAEAKKAEEAPMPRENPLGK